MHLEASNSVSKHRKGKRARAAGDASIKPAKNHKLSRRRVAYGLGLLGCLLTAEFSSEIFGLTAFRLSAHVGSLFSLRARDDHRSTTITNNVFLPLGDRGSRPVRRVMHRAAAIIHVQAAGVVGALQAEPESPDISQVSSDPAEQEVPMNRVPHLKSRRQVATARAAVTFRTAEGDIKVNLEGVASATGNSQAGATLEVEIVTDDPVGSLPGTVEPSATPTLPAATPPASGAMPSDPGPQLPGPYIGSLPIAAPGGPAVNDQAP